MHAEGAESLHKCLKELEIKKFKYSYSREELDEEFMEVKALIEKVGFEGLKKIDACEDIKLKTTMIILEEM